MNWERPLTLDFKVRRSNFFAFTKRKVRKRRTPVVGLALTKSPLAPAY